MTRNTIAKRILLPAVLMLGLFAPASASGSLSCEASDKSLTFSAGSGLSRGGGQFLNLKGQLQINDAGVPRDLRKLDLGEDDVTQKWLYGKDLKLRFYRERDSKLPHGTLEFVVETRESKADETIYTGSYILWVLSYESDKDNDGKRVTLRGRVTCTTGE